MRDERCICRHLEGEHEYSYSGCTCCECESFIYDKWAEQVASGGPHAVCGLPEMIDEKVARARRWANQRSRT
jgi:hypothetical protein